MATFSPQELYVIDNDGQTDIELKYSYTPGSGNLLVFLNGMVCAVDEDYEEIDELHLQFKYQLSVDDTIIIRHQVNLPDRNVSVIGRPGSSLFQTLGTEETLYKNQDYTMHFSMSGQHFSTSFHTIIDPFYSTIQIIENDLGDILDNISPKRLVFLIHQNSVLAQNIASEDNLELLETETKTPYVFKQFVRYRTELDIMMAIYMNITGRMGSAKKVLGEFEVEKRTDLGSVDITIILADLKANLRSWEKQLRGVTLVSPVASAVRGGEAYAYPLTSPRIF